MPFEYYNKKITDLILKLREKRSISQDIRNSYDDSIQNYKNDIQSIKEMPEVISEFSSVLSFSNFIGINSQLSRFIKTLIDFKIQEFIR